MELPAKKLWQKWQEQVKQILPAIHGHRTKALALLVFGMVLSSSAVLQRIAESLRLSGVSEAKMPSIERRLARFVANKSVVVTQIWDQFLEQILTFWRDQRLLFVLDGTPCGEHATIIYLGLLVHSRVLPVAWCVMPGQSEWEQRQWDLVAGLLDRVRPYLGQAECTLIADRGLAGFPLVQICQQRQWHYLIRVCKEHTCRRWIHDRWMAWQPLSQIVFKPGQHCYGQVQLWQDQMLQTNVSAIWEPGHKEAWFLISDLPAGKSRVREYALRMRVESTFQDDKSRGWNLEASLIQDLSRLDRLLLALFLAMWWVGHLAASCMHHGKRDLFDRHDRRDKGIFRLGRIWLLDILARTTNLAALARCLPFTKQPAGWRLALRF